MGVKSEVRGVTGGLTVSLSNRDRDEVWRTKNGGNLLTIYDQKILVLLTRPSEDILGLAGQ